MVVVMTALWLTISSAASSREISYTQADSLKVIDLLAKGANQEQDSNTLMLYFARQLTGTPYKSATLEINKREKLVVNLRQLDCKTYIETVTALTLTTLSPDSNWDTYCAWLERIRYTGGVNHGYTSRNHYFTSWIDSNTDAGICHEVKREGKPWTAQQKLHIDYMSRNPQLYPMLRGNQHDISLIRQHEQALTGRTISYIPKALLNQGRNQLRDIHDGDIIAIVTKRRGLDTSHTGIAVWGKDGKLHLLNASKPYRRVILDPQPICQTLGKWSNPQGVRIVRINQIKGKTP